MSDNWNCILDFEGSVEMTEDENMERRKWKELCIYYIVAFAVIAGCLIGLKHVTGGNSRDIGASAEKEVTNFTKKSTVATTSKSSSYKEKTTSSSSTKVEDCISIGCSNEKTFGSVYCIEHAVKAKEKKEVKKVKPSSTSTKKKTKKIYDPYDSYDAGYEDVYEDDDYDWDRYWSDDDYADGVDDAMEDMDW